LSKCEFRCTLPTISRPARSLLAMDATTNVATYAVVFVESCVAAGIWSAWSCRLRRKTNFRGNGAADLMKEFQGYGYPIWLFKFAGAILCCCASMLIIAIMNTFLSATLLDATLSFAFVCATWLLISRIVYTVSDVEVSDTPRRSQRKRRLQFCEL